MNQGGEKKMDKKRLFTEIILREQLKLLAERSKSCDVELLPVLTAAMVEIHRELVAINPLNQFGLTSE